MYAHMYLISLPLQFAFFAPRSVSGVLSPPREQLASVASFIAKGGGAKRLHIISVTGLGKCEQLAIVAQSSWGKRLANSDNYTNVCDDGCGDITVGGHRLTHVLPMPNTVCSNGSCSGKIKAQLKFVWGFIHEYKRIRSEGGQMPMWWFVKDDDTYVHVDRLMALAAKYNPDDRVFIGKTETADICCAMKYGAPFFVEGGAGWLASAAMAEALVMELGDEWLKRQQDAVEKHVCPWYDQQMGFILPKVAHGTIVKMSLAQFWGSGHHDPVCPPYPDLITLQMKKQWEDITDDANEMTQLTENCFREPAPEWGAGSAPHVEEDAGSSERCAAVRDGT